jgi:trehalose 6-phosphate phosphatase
MSGHDIGLPAPNSGWALFLDFDGTLVEIAERPDAIRVERRLAGTLGRLSGLLGGAVAIVSGRPLAEIDRHLSPARLPAAGLHGLELRPRPDRPARSRRAGAIPQQVVARLEDFAGRAGLLLEHKGPAMALHYRNRPDLADLCRSVVREAVRDLPDLHVLDGKMVLEVKPAGGDKGRAVRAFMQHAPFRGRVPVFVGDDITDEDGFRAVNELGGFGVKVGAGPTLARYRADSVPELRAWLERAVSCLANGAGKGVEG